MQEQDPTSNFQQILNNLLELYENWQVGSGVFYETPYSI